MRRAWYKRGNSIQNVLEKPRVGGFLVWARAEVKGGQGDSGWIFMEIMLNMFLSELQYMLHNKNKEC